MLDLDRDLPTSPEDIAALRRLRSLPGLDFDQYLHFLSSFPPPSNEELRSRRGPHGDEPFVLR
jgi:hypothetical protein